MRTVLWVSEKLGVEIMAESDLDEPYYVSIVSDHTHSKTYGESLSLLGLGYVSKNEFAPASRRWATRDALGRVVEGRTMKAMAEHLCQVALDRMNADRLLKSVKAK